MGTHGPFEEYIGVCLISVADLDAGAEDDEGDIGGRQVVQTC